MATGHTQPLQWKNDLLPNHVDRLARETPQALYAEYPVSPLNYDEGYRQITYRDYANAINGAAWWLSDVLGQSKEHEVLAYIGPNDIRYTVLALAALKAGYVLFLTSPRNSVAAHFKLFERLKCTKLLSPDPKPAAVSAILEEPGMQHFAVPSAQTLLDQDYPHFEFAKTFDEARHEPFMIIHTSGSTGFPKPMTYTHETMARNINAMVQDPPAGFRSVCRLVQGKRLMNAFPPFHAACLFVHFLYAVPFGTVIVAPVSGAVITAQGVVDALHQTAADVALLIPSIIIEMSQSDALIDYCSRTLECCLYGGGDLPQAVGNKVASKLPIVCQYGASELGLTPMLLPETMDPYDWKYMSFHPCIGTEIREVADGSYELFICHSAEKEHMQGTFTIFPDLKEYASNDIFQRHPTMPNFWRWHARADDIIVFENGEKTNPISMEQHIVARNPEVVTAIVVGTQRFQAALMLEPALNAVPQSTAEEAAFIEKVWPSIQEANNVAPAHARIEKAMILLMSQKKPALRTAKNTVQKAATLQQYSAELDKLYQDAEMGPDDDSNHTWESAQIHGLEAILKSVREIVTEVLGNAEMSDHDNFFAIGVDSLLALRIMRSLRKTFRLPDIATSTVYSNASIARLSEAIDTLQVNQSSQVVDQAQNREKSITSILEEYQDQIRKIPESAGTEEQPEKSTVILTGSTGGLGTHILGALLNDPTVEHVFCLNRRDDGLKIQQHRSDSSHLNLDLTSSRVTFLKTDLAEAYLGLPPATYDSLRTRSTSIIHNAWPVNFNLPLDAFHPHLTGLVNLFALSASAPYIPRVFFISSVGAAINLRTPSRLTPEAIVRDASGPIANGYSESKHVCELLADFAASELHLPAAVARVGQVAGAARRQGLWNPAEWFPSLVRSSVDMGVLPDSLGPGLGKIDWVPVDLLAEVLVELALRPAQVAEKEEEVARAAVFHPHNGHSTSWQALLPGVRAAIEEVTSKKVEVVSAKEWLARLRRSEEGEKSEEELAALVVARPALKILEFYEGTLVEGGGEESNRFDTTRTMEASAKLREVEEVGDVWMRKWIAEWLHVDAEANGSK
ncbi:MAG: hypothetical protein Q9165_002823 [Trypethelium subeluteriae]